MRDYRIIIAIILTELVDKGYAVTNAIDVPVKSSTIPFEYR